MFEFFTKKNKVFKIEYFNKNGIFQGYKIISLPFEANIYKETNGISVKQFSFKISEAKGLSLESSDNVTIVERI